MSSEFQNNTNPTNDTTRAPRLFDRWSLTFKIIAWYTIFLSAVLILLSVFIFQFTQRWESNELNTRLESTAVTMADNLNQFQPYQKGSFYILYSQEGLILKGALPDGFPKQTIMSPNKIAEITINDMTYYYYDTPTHDGAFNGWIRGIAPIRNVNSRTANMLYTLLFGGIAFLIIATLGGYLLIKRSLKPVRDITKTAAEITNSRNLSRRIPAAGSGDDELSELTVTLNKMFKALDDSSTRERQFSSDVSHELRTPIAVIKAEADFGRKHIKDLGEAKEAFTNIYQKSRFMTDLISQLLDLARLDQFDSLAKQEINLSSMLHTIAHDYERLSEENHIKFSANIADNICLTCHPAALQRAIGNFLDNAFKFTRSQVKLKSYRLHGAVVISVEDDGPGIPEEALPKIWNRLYQTDASRSHKKNKGVGLGLYFVRRVAQLHKAAVDVQSTPNVKTTFSLVIPLDQES